MFTINSIIIQLPVISILNKVPLNYAFLALDIAWSLVTVGAAHVDEVPHIKVIRSFIGAFEAPLYLAYQYLFGCFYKYDETKRRSAFYYFSHYIGILSASGIQSSVYSYHDGTNNLSGCKWRFIVDAIISILVAVFGF